MGAVRLKAAPVRSDPPVERLDLVPSHSDVCLGRSIDGVDSAIRCARRWTPSLRSREDDGGDGARPRLLRRKEEPERPDLSRVGRGVPRRSQGRRPGIRRALPRHPALGRRPDGGGREFRQVEVTPGRRAEGAWRAAAPSARRSIPEGLQVLVWVADPAHPRSNLWARRHLASTARCDSGIRGRRARPAEPYFSLREETSES